MPKILVLYPYPADAEKFEREYTEDHTPMVTEENFPGIKKFVASKAIGTPDGSRPQFYRVAELHFDSMEDLQNAASSEGAQQTVGHAVSISSGGPPVVLVAEEETTDF